MAEPKNEKRSDEQNTSDEKKYISRRAGRRIFNLVLSLCVIAAIVIVNIIAGTLTSKFSAFTADITSMKNFELTEQSVKVAQNVTKPVTITFLMSKASYEAYDTYCKQTSFLAERMALTSNGMIKTEYVDLIQNPTFANNYSDENLSTTDIIVSSGKKYDVLDKTELFNFEQYSESYSIIKSSKSEQAIDNSILKVTSDESTKVAFITDTPTDDYSYFEQTLSSNNYEASTIKIESNTIPSDIQTLILYAPQKDFTPDALEKIRAYLDNSGKYGRNLLYIPSETKYDTPNLDSFIAEYGMEVGDGLAFDMDTNRLMSQSYYEAIIASYSSKLYRDNLDENSSPVLVGLCRPVYISNLDSMQSLLTLSDQSGYCPFSAEEGSWSMTDAVVGDMCVMAQSQIGKDTKSTIVLAGSKAMFTKPYLGSNYSNSTYIFDMLATLNGRSTDMVKVSEKVISEYDLSISQNVAMSLGVVVFAILPLLILGTGLVMHIVRRNR